MPFKTPNGQYIEDRQLEAYLKRNATSTQIQRWINTHEEPYFIFGSKYPASKVAYALFGPKECKDMIIDFVVSMGDQPYDFSPFGLKYVDRTPKTTKRA